MIEYCKIYKGVTRMKYLIDSMDLSVEEIDDLIDLAQDIIKDKYTNKIIVRVSYVIFRREGIRVF